MKCKLSLAVALAITCFPVCSTASDNSPLVPRGADRFIGTYVEVPQGRMGGIVRYAIEKDGEHYRLYEITPGAKNKGLYQEYKFVRKSDDQLTDAEEILGTLTLGDISFDKGAIPSSVVQASFCYTQFLLIKENTPYVTVKPRGASK